MMKLYDITETPLKIYGLAVADSEKRQFFKLSEDCLLYTSDAADE